VGAPALARRCDVQAKYASHLHPSCGWVSGAPPGIWTFLSSLGNNGFFSNLLGPGRHFVLSFQPVHMVTFARSYADVDSAPELRRAEWTRGCGGGPAMPHS